MPITPERYNYSPYVVSAYIVYNYCYVLYVSLPGVGIRTVCCYSVHRVMSYRITAPTNCVFRVWICLRFIHGAYSGKVHVYVVWLSITTNVMTCMYHKHWDTKKIVVPGTFIVCNTNMHYDVITLEGNTYVHIVIYTCVTRIHKIGTCLYIIIQTMYSGLCIAFYMYCG